MESNARFASKPTLRAARCGLLLLSLVLAACGGGGGYGGGGSGGGSMGGGYSPPTITSQPKSMTVNSGQTATFDVAATGYGTLNYQWMMNSSDIAGATQDTYTTPMVTSADNNEQFAVKVSNAYGSKISEQAVLTVN